MRTRHLLAAALLACAGARPFVTHGEPVVTFEGKISHSPAVVGAADLASLPRRKVEAAPPTGGPPVAFEGLAVAAFLADQVDVQREGDVAVFRGERGWAAAVPIAVIRQLKPVLADRAGGEGVAAWRKEAAPLQLAWPVRDWPGIDSDPRLRWWWVGGVRSVEILSWLETYGKALRVPPGASDEARLGADVLQTSCLTCHRVRGVGGTRGPELTARLAGEGPALAARMRGHLRKTSGMADAPEPPPAAAGQVLAFLRAVELGGRPEDEPREPEAPEVPPAIPATPAPITGGE